ncbi:glycosyltransferase family 39 protein [Cytophagaceae bacterium ABcell3]|nr:glycosyltransferase family 39 protein [Cytophagaceae bacterium ABcell3]
MTRQKLFSGAEYSSGFYISVFLIFWLTINLIQGGLIQLAHDESYYWMFSRFPDWGYFDHPPAIAVLIKAGYTLFQNEFGVRFFIAISSTLAVYLIWKMTDKDKKDVLLFAAIAFSISMFNASGFLAVPDIPLILFTALFFYVYKYFLQHPGIKSELLLAVTIALLLYSKYHGVLVLFFVILSNPLLLIRVSFWRIVLFSFVLFLPHILWQIDNDYPSLRYHLVTRSTDPYQVRYTLDYLLGQLLVTGPFIGIFVLYTAFSYKVSNQFERALKYTMFGIFFFFFLSTFKGWVEANWTIPAFIPLIILSYNKALYHEKLRKWILYLTIPSVIFIAGARFLMVSDITWKSLGFKTQFHGWDQWAQEIEEIAEGRPVVFINSYQWASKYNFYSDQGTGHSYNTSGARGNMYDFWPFEDSLQGKNIIKIHRSPLPDSDSLKTVFGEYIYYRHINNFRSYNKVDIEVLPENLEFDQGDTIRLPIRIKNNFKQTVDFNANPDLMAKLLPRMFEEHPTPTQLKQDIITNRLEPGASVDQEVKVIMPDFAGTYTLRIDIAPGWMKPGQNSKNYTVIVK